MIIHYHGRRYHVQDGSGFGSVFARIFSRVAAKTAARAALRTAKVVGKKVLKTAARKGVKVMKTAGKELAKEAVRAGVEEGSKAIVGVVNKAENMAINKGVSPELAHKLSTSVEEGANRLLSNVEKRAVHGADKLIDAAARNINRKVGNRSAEELAHKILTRRKVKRRRRIK